MNGASWRELAKSGQSYTDMNNEYLFSLLNSYALHCYDLELKNRILEAELKSARLELVKLRALKKKIINYFEDWSVMS